MNEDDANFVAAVEQLQAVQVGIESGAYDTNLNPSIADRHAVLARFQPIFARAHLPELNPAEFRAFLMFRNNRHWSGLHRLGPRLVKDIDALRHGLEVLLYGDGPIAERYDATVGQVDGMGRAVATAILLTVYPEEYGVWNAKSDAGLKRLGLWPRAVRGETEGARYTRINDVLLRLRDALGIDLWTLDALWHYLTLEPGEDVDPDIEDEEEEVLPGPAEVERPAARFGLERHLHDFLWDNWDEIELGREWKRHTEAGDENAGYEYRCDVGRVDILARHRTTGDWLVVELKRDRTSDVTAAQTMRYMGWIQENRAVEGETVKGLIICREWDRNLHYAAKVVPNLEVMLYRVSFALEPAAGAK